MTALEQLRHRLSEACDDLWKQVVDPRDAWRDDEGDWLPLGTSAGRFTGGGFSEHELFAVQQHCRRLAISNEFAINGHENRISYIVGTGHVYRALPRKGGTADDTLAAEVQRVIDEFLETNRWAARQQELVRRTDRDGEAFLRFFPQADGSLAVRFVEPDQVRTPPSEQGDPQTSHGIAHAPGDIETPRIYYIDGAPVDAQEIQHRKANVDANSPRGLPLFYPVMGNLRRAEKLLRNMSAVAEIQSAIALIRRHTQGTRAGIEQFVSQSNDAPRSPTPVRRYEPGTILDAPAGLEYDFPAAGIEARQFVEILQAELRAIAARLVLPEFMLTSDASNANYASTLVAEGPAMKMFARLQAETIAADRAVLRRAVEQATLAGRLPVEASDQVEIQITAPSLKVRDERQEAEVLQIEHAAGILSPQTWSQMRGLDYEQEQANIRKSEVRS